jgi:type IV pilus assembly protein PilX
MGNGKMTVRNTCPAAGTPPRSAQRGVVLFISLIVLVAMTLAGIALFRQVGTGVIIAGNLAFKDNATSVGDYGLESARTWLMNTKTAGIDTNTDQANYYCAAWQSNFDPATFDWTAAASDCANNKGSYRVTADDGTGNEVRYIVHRMCRYIGSLNKPAPPNDTQPQECVVLGAAGAGGSKGGGQYGVLPLSNTQQPYFRITVRVTGPRNTVSFVQSMMY